MSDEAAFLEVIRSNPRDPAARLVYADWLDERADARGEYLRLQVESERIRSRMHSLRQSIDPGWLTLVSMSKPIAPFPEDDQPQVDAGAEQASRQDWEMLNYGPIALFRKLAVLTETITWLARSGYAIAQADCEACQSEQEILWAIGGALGFHRWSSPNLDGFNDDCRHIEVAPGGGIAVVLHRFDRAFARWPKFARSVLDILAHAVYDNLLLGRRMICLVRSEDPWIQFGPLGGHEPWWNGREWFNADRA